MRTEEARGRPGPPSPRVAHLKSQVRRKARAPGTRRHDGKSSATRARMILLRVENVPVREVGGRLGVSDDSVQRWCDRFVQTGRWVEFLTGHIGGASTSLRRGRGVYGFEGLVDVDVPEVEVHERHDPAAVMLLSDSYVFVRERSGDEDGAL